jgi:hypothetical protein
MPRVSPQKRPTFAWFFPATGEPRHGGFIHPQRSHLVPSLQLRGSSGAWAWKNMPCEWGWYIHLKHCKYVVYKYRIYIYTCMYAYVYIYIHIILYYIIYIHAYIYCICIYVDKSKCVSMGWILKPRIIPSSDIDYMRIMRNSVSRGVDSP